MDAWLPEPELLSGSGVVTLEEVRDVACVVLLGEPGAGKSYALEHEADAARRLAREDDDVLFVDLGDPQDGRELRERVFEDAVVERWGAGSGRLHLSLDALDEAKVQIRKVVSLLETGLGRLDLSRLVLRVTCRTAERPLGLEAWLKQAFGEDNYRTLELAPLRLSETESGARAAGVDSEKFLKDVVGAGVAPLAARPLTLRMLLRVYATGGRFPDALAALYEQALRLMATEDDEERRVLRNLSDTASIAVAARIAAATVLTGRDVVGDGVAGGIGLDELAGGNEVDRLVAQPSEVVVDDAALREVLNTALFTARTGGLGWAHRTFGEYLAAFWLAGERLSDAQIGDLLLVDDGSGRRIAPPLRNVAGWLLTLRKGFERQLEPADATVLVHGDPASVAPEMRRRLLPALLDAIGDQAVERVGIRSLWRRLAYEGIANDLDAALTDTSVDDQARQAAMDAVAELELVELVPALVDIALSDAESPTLRTTALERLRSLGDAVPVDRLRPLAMLPQQSDPDDEIKGSALGLCWPGAMTTDELFGALTPEKNEALIGTYTRFLRQDCAPHLTSPDDLLAGVRWALTVPREWDSTRDVTILADVVVGKAWPLAATDWPIAEALADLVVLVTERHMPVFASASSLRRNEAPDSVLHDAAAVEAIIEVLVGRAARKEISLEILQRAALLSLGDIEDLGRLVERWAATGDDTERQAWQVAILALARGSAADALFDVRKAYPDLYAYVAWRYEAVLIDSPEAEVMRQRWITEEEAPQVPAQEVVDPAQFDQQVVAELDAFAAGDVDGYWRMQYALMVDDDGFVRDREHTDDLTKTSGWRRADPEVRAAIVNGAARYLRQMDPDHSRWLGIEQSYWPAWAGYSALKLLFTERRTAFDKLDATVWQRWAPIVVGWRATDQGHDEFRQVAMERIRELAADVARSTAVAEFLHRPARWAIERARDRLGSLWDASTDDALFAQLTRTDLPREQVLAVAGDLIAHGHAGALAWAALRVAAEPICDAEQREASLGLADVLARHAPAVLWTLVKGTVASDTDAAKLLLGRLAHESGSGWSSHLEPEQLGELFGWLQQYLPPESAPGRQRTGAVTTAMEASFWRSRILELLVTAGTQAAVDAVVRLEEELDQFGWIRSRRHRAQEELRRAMWAPPQPADVVRMGSVDRARYVPDAVALRRLVLEALAGIAADTRGAFPLAPALWNTSPYRLPRSENEITNELARWLRDRIGGRRAIVNREVEVNAVSGTGGDRTDLLIQAESTGDRPLSVVVEVKGAWNAELMTAMPDQLVDQYLKPDLTDQGVYLVFWFAPAGWDGHDDNQKRRRARATRSGAAELEALLVRQAAEVSRERGVAVTAVVMDGSFPPAA